ncbi:MAG: hypothetical protein QF685_10120 [Verrucomicrobiota bacterium]|jgi:hypothetical protein|nr:hypothetical protein [Verrucomicrobiota bacterium]
MKKYLITLAVMALAIGGSINFAGCAPSGDHLTGDTKGENAEPVMSEEEGNKKAESGEEAAGGDDGGEEKGGEEKK